MRLYFLRHGKAEQQAASDHERELTPAGAERIAVAATVMAKLGLAPGHIFSSPRVRARQTAAIVAGALGKTVEIDDAVNFSFDLEAVETLVRDLADDEEVMFVGHEPSMSLTVGQLTGADVRMKVGGLARVDVENDLPLRGQLIWLIAPVVFDALGEPDTPDL